MDIALSATYAGCVAILTLFSGFTKVAMRTMKKVTLALYRCAHCKVAQHRRFYAFRKAQFSNGLFTHFLIS